jgi:DNA-binding helix-hairpin-helix protein with protein kinase domain
MRNLINLVFRFHKAGLIIEDVNPSNLVISSDGNIGLIDFDYSYFIGEKWHHGGVQDFAPPNNFIYADAHDVDLYSLMGALFFIATGRVPYIRVCRKIK